MISPTTEAGNARYSGFQSALELGRGLMIGWRNKAHPPWTLFGFLVWDLPRTHLETCLLVYLFIWEVTPLKLKHRSGESERQDGEKATKRSVDDLVIVRNS